MTNTWHDNAKKQPQGGWNMANTTGKMRRGQSTTGVQGTHAIFFFLISILMTSLTYQQHPLPPKTSRCSCFQGYDLSMATTTAHNPRKWAIALVFGGYDPLATTTPESECNSSSLATTSTRNYIVHRYRACIHSIKRKRKRRKREKHACATRQWNQS